MACFLYTLTGRNAVINIPTYKGHSQTKFKTGQKLLSKENRHGQLLGVRGNKETFGFSIVIKDMNVMKSDEVGDYRNFSMTDFNGEWYSGWKKIEFIPSVRENNFIMESKILSENTISFKNFIHPNRWTSFFGKYYFVTKLLMDRLTEESSYYRSLIKKMLEEGINYPISDKQKTKTYTDDSIDKGKQIKIKSFEVEVDIPRNETEFPKYESSQENLVKLTNLINKFTYTFIPGLRFMTRATELAHYKKQDAFPAWLENVKWEKDYKQKGKRKNWDRLVLFQDKPGEIGISIRKREYEKSIRVSENF